MAEPTSPTIYDLGMHNGDDTEYYLRFQEHFGVDIRPTS